MICWEESFGRWALPDWKARTDKSRQPNNRKRPGHIFVELDWFDIVPRFPEVQVQQQEQKQIPFGNDKNKKVTLN
jgi:hypothetical protein